MWRHAILVKALVSAKHAKAATNDVAAASGIPSRVSSLANMPADAALVAARELFNIPLGWTLRRKIRAQVLFLSVSHFL